MFWGLGVETPTWNDATSPQSSIYSFVVEHEPVHFADPNLKATVEAALQKTNPTPTDMLGLTELRAESIGITNLTGLEYATNLVYLDLTGNGVGDPGPLSGLTSLSELILSGNCISDISALSGLTNLTYLDLTSTNLADLSSANSHGKCNTSIEATSRVRSGSLELFKDFRLRSARDVVPSFYPG